MRINSLEALKDYKSCLCGVSSGKTSILMSLASADWPLAVKVADADPRRIGRDCPQGRGGFLVIWACYASRRLSCVTRPSFRDLRACDLEQNPRFWQMALIEAPARQQAHVVLS